MASVWRVLLIAAVVTCSARADADRVVLVNAARDPAAGQAALDRLRTAARTGGHTVVTGPVAEAVERPASDPLADDAEVRELVAKAKQDLVRFDYAAVHTRVRAAESHYASTGPSAQAASLLADLNFQDGIAYAGEKNDTRALDAFRLVRALDPQRTALDAATYKPHLVELYEKAGQRTDGAPAALAPALSPGDARLWLDGRDGAAAELSPGPHYVGATASGYGGTIVRVNARAGGKVAPSLQLAELPPSQLARRESSQLVGTSDPAPHARAIASLSQADIVVIVRHDPDGALVAALGTQSGLGAFGPIRGVEDTLARGHTALVAQTSGGKGGADAIGAEASGPGTVAAGHASFWRSRGGIALIVITVAVIVTGTIVLTTRGDDTTHTTYQVGPPCFSGTAGCM